MKIRSTTAVASCLVVALAVPFGHSTAQTVKSVAGTYAIVSTEIFGKGARGYLMLAPDGHYSLTIMRATLPKFASGNRTKNTPEAN